MSKRKHRHLDGTEHTDGKTIRVPRTAPRPWIDARILLVAGLIASPAAYRSSQGLLSAGAALDRFLIIAVGCLFLTGAVRVVWPLLLGDPTPATKTVAGVAMPAAAADALDASVIDSAYAGLDDFGPMSGMGGMGELQPGDLDALGLPPIGSGLDLIEDEVDPTALLQLPPGPR